MESRELIAILSPKTGTQVNLRLLTSSMESGNTPHSDAAKSMMRRLASVGTSSNGAVSGSGSAVRSSEERTTVAAAISTSFGWAKMFATFSTRPSLRLAVTSRMAPIESPPRRKKESSTPTASAARFKTEDHRRASVVSTWPEGARPLLPASR
jgi:hypothetical protein